jgi:hypothetical protein
MPFQPWQKFDPLEFNHHSHRRAFEASSLQSPKQSRYFKKERPIYQHANLALYSTPNSPLPSTPVSSSKEHQEFLHKPMDAIKKLEISPTSVSSSSPQRIPDSSSTSSALSQAGQHLLIDSDFQLSHLHKRPLLHKRACSEPLSHQKSYSQLSSVLATLYGDSFSSKNLVINKSPTPAHRYLSGSGKMDSKCSERLDEALSNIKKRRGGRRARSRRVATDVLVPSTSLDHDMIFKTLDISTS